MKKLIAISAAILCGLGASPMALAGDDFYGVIERRPSGKVGTWVVGGRTFKATSETELEDKRRLRLGRCAQVERDDGVVEEIEPADAHKCPNLRKKKRANKRQPTDDFYGVIQRRPKGKTGTWVVGDYRFRVSRDVELDAGYAPLKVGACVEVDIDNGRVEEIESKPMHKCSR